MYIALPSCNRYYLKHNIGVPRILRSDCGTENTHIAFLQPYLRRNHTDCFSGSASYRYGKSVSNQVYNILTLQLSVHRVLTVFNYFVDYSALRLGGHNSRGGAPSGGMTFSL